jgi:hypothetical protein
MRLQAGKQAISGDQWGPVGTRPSVGNQCCVAMQTERSQAGAQDDHERVLGKLRQAALQAGWAEWQWQSASGSRICRAACSRMGGSPGLSTENTRVTSKADAEHLAGFVGNTQDGLGFVGNTHDGLGFVGNTQDGLGLVGNTQDGLGLVGNTQDGAYQPEGCLGYAPWPWLPAKPALACHSCPALPSPAKPLSTAWVKGH